MTFDRETPYNNLPPLPPSPEVVASSIENIVILKRAIAANRALAQLKGRTALLPNPAILIDNLTLLEAKDSSEIENIFTTQDKLFQADVLTEKNVDPHTKEVRLYRQAIWHGARLIRERPLCTNTFVEVVQTLKQNGAEIRKTPGTKIATPQGETIYTPPEGEPLIRQLLSNLEQFLHTDDGLDPLVKMAISHYQFEAIHPFSDGNGRTGRINNILFLIEQQLIDLPILFLSRYIIKNKNPYYLGLKRVTEEQDWQNWILYMLEAVEVTSLETLTLIDSIVVLMDNFKQTFKTKSTLRIPLRELIEVVFKQPFCRINNLIEADITTSRITAKKYLTELVRLGLMSEVRIGHDLIYVNDGLYRLLKTVD